MTTAPLRASRILLATITLLSAALSRPVAGQTSLPVEAGTRVRVSASNLVVPLVANFLSVKGDTAVFIEDGGGKGVWSIPVYDIRKIEKSDGVQRGNARFMIRTGVVGAAVGLGSGLIFANNFSPSDDSRKYNRWGVGAAGAGIGAVIGALIGSRFTVEKWTGIPLRSAAITPSGRGVNARVSLGF